MANTTQPLPVDTGSLASGCVPCPDHFSQYEAVDPPEGIKYPNPHDFNTGKEYWDAVHEFQRLSNEHEAKTGKHFKVMGEDFWRGLPIFPWNDPSEIRTPNPAAWAIREKFSMFVRPETTENGAPTRGH